MKNKGFTMLELLVVIAVIGIVAALGFPTFMEQRDRARIKGREGTWCPISDGADQRDAGRQNVDRCRLIRLETSYSLIHAGADGRPGHGR